MTCHQEVKLACCILNIVGCEKAEHLSRTLAAGAPHPCIPPTRRDPAGSGRRRCDPEARLKSRIDGMDYPALPPMEKKKNTLVSLSSFVSHASVCAHGR